MMINGGITIKTWKLSRTTKQKLFQRISMERKQPEKPVSFYILLIFPLITIVLLLAVSIYCYLMKYRTKQKQLIPFHFTSNTLKEIIY